jgi:hypothetical protein
MFKTGCSKEEGKTTVIAGPKCEDNLREASRHFTNKKREYLKDKTNKVVLNSKNKNIRDMNRGITDFKKGYQPKNNLVKHKRGDLLADTQRILTRWKNYFCQLLNVQGAGGIRQTEIHTAEPFVPESTAAEVEIAIRKFKRYKAPGSDLIPVKQIRGRGGIAF